MEFVQLNRGKYSAHQWEEFSFNLVCIAFIFCLLKSTCLISKNRPFFLPDETL